eukprot:scaffold337642_cov21-Prasinocladus_malaysianus.AAC.2
MPVHRRYASGHVILTDNGRLCSMVSNMNSVVLDIANIARNSANCTHRNAHLSPPKPCQCAWL